MPPPACGVDAGSPGVTLALHRQLGCLAHDQGCRCTLRVVTGREGARHVARLARPRAGQRRHDHSMRQLEKVPLVRLEQRVGVRSLPDARAAATVVASSIFPPFEGKPALGQPHDGDLR
jgi:hypothetical protein